MKKIFVLSLILLTFISGCNNEDLEPPITEQEPEIDYTVINQYKLTENATEYQTALFRELYDTLSNDTVNDEAFALDIAKNFSAEFLSFINRKSKDDIGGIQFIKEDLKGRFIDYGTEYYKFFEYYKIEYGENGLADVESVELVSQNEIEYTYKDEKYLGYEIELQIIYTDETKMNKFKLLNNIIVTTVKFDNDFNVMKMSNK